MDVKKIQAQTEAAQGSRTLLRFVSVLKFILCLCLAPTSTRAALKVKPLVFQARYHLTTKTANQAEPVMDGKWTAVDRPEDGGAASV